MGHLISSKAHLVPLIDRLNRYPVGLVDNEKLRDILALLFSEEEASIAACSRRAGLSWASHTSVIRRCSVPAACAISANCSVGVRPSAESARTPAASCRLSPPTRF